MALPDTAKPTQPPTRADQRLIPAGRLLVDPDSKELDYNRSVLLGQGHEVRACASYDEGTLLLARERFD